MQETAPPEYTAHAPSGAPPPASAGHALSITDDDLAGLLAIPPVPSSGKGAAAFNQPVALVHQDGALFSPIAQSYAPILSMVGLDKPSFKTFLDVYDEIAAADPPTSIVDALSGGTQLVRVPFHWSLQTPTNYQSGLSIEPSTTDRFLFQANKRLFEPRGLRCRLVRGEALRVICGLEPSKTGLPLQIGRGAETVVGHIPLVGIVANPLKHIGKGLSMAAYRATRDKYAVRHAAPFVGHIAPSSPIMGDTSGASSSSRISQQLEVRKGKTTTQLALYLERVRTAAGKDQSTVFRSPIAISNGFYLNPRRETDPADRSLWLVIYPQTDEHLQTLDSHDNMLQPIQIDQAAFQQQLNIEFAVDATRYSSKGSI